MTLRTSGQPSASAGLRRRPLRLAAALVGAAALLLTSFAGSTGAGVSSYTGTVYLDGPGSSVSSNSFRLTTYAGPAAPAAPTTVAGTGGSLAAASYQYIYIASSGGARTASAASTALAVAAGGSVTVSGVPLGSDLYRARVTSGVVLGSYVLASPGGGTDAVPYVDTGAISGSALPQADTRHAIGAGAVGWSEFAPGVGLASTLVNSSVSASAPVVPSTCKGWVVDGSGGMSFAAGTWTLQARVKPGANPNGTAVLSAGMWKVGDSGATTGGYIVSPTDGDVITNTTGIAVTATVSASPGAFTLANNEHLCVQFWRHQTVAYASGGASNRSISLLGWDVNNQVTLHPAPNGFASAALSSPSDGAVGTSVPTLGATYSDPEADAGNLTIRLCTDSGCSSSPQNSGAMAATNGSTQSWTPAGPLADGTYYWQAQAQDGLGLASAWTASRSFVIDNAPPTTAITSNPPAVSNAASGSFAFNANEPVTGYQCRVDGAAFASCSSPSAYGPLADGPHSFDVKAVADLAGNPGTTSTYSWSIDLPPNTSITSGPPALSNSTSPNFGLSSTDPGSTFECSLDGAPFAPCPNPQTYSSVADGAHTFQARAVDPFGSVDPTPSSYSWSIDTVAPNVPVLDLPADDAWVHNIKLGATFGKPSFAGMGFVDLRLCSDALCLGIVRSGSSDGVLNGALTSWSPGSQPADGLYYWQARGRDTVGNVSAWTASRVLHVDSLAPGEPRSFHGDVGPEGLILRWDPPPAESVGNYVVFVNGAPWKNLGGSEFEARMGAFDANDARTFSVVAVDRAGNVGEMSPVLVGVPSLVGLTWLQAVGAATARGLTLQQQGGPMPPSVPLLVTGQNPAVPGVAERGSALGVSVAPPKGTPLAITVDPARVVCAGGAIVKLHLRLSAPATVKNKLVNGHGRVIDRSVVGRLRAGSSSVKIKLPQSLQKGTYRLLLDAAGKDGTARATVRVGVGRGVCGAR
jgi:large repetitive protein